MVVSTKRKMAGEIALCGWRRMFSGVGGNLVGAAGVGHGWAFVVIIVAWGSWLR